MSSLAAVIFGFLAVVGAGLLLLSAVIGMICWFFKALLSCVEGE